MEGCFRVNSPPVVLETVDEETIIVNLDSGSYYDLNHSGGRVLEALAAGADTRAAIDRVASSYGIESSDLAAPARALVERLVEEGILVAQEEPAPSNGSNGAGAADPAASKPYEDPALSKYTDMQELLLLDPVHEVDGAGWPNKV